VNRLIHKASIWSIVASLPFIGAGLVLARIFPPLSPTESAATVAARYAEHELQIRIGLVMVMLATALFIPFFASLVWEVKKMTGERNTVAPTIQAIGATCIVIFVFIPMFMFMIAAFRADRSPEVVQALHDLGWFTFIGPVSFFSVQMFFLGLAILMDRQAVPTFPRWFGYATFVLALDTLGGGFIVLTRTGPFAWDGALAYYVPILSFLLWMAGIVIYLLRSADREWAAGA
jgi:hypothetical protein